MTAQGQAMVASRRLDRQLKREHVAAALDALAATGQELSIAAIARHADVSRQVHLHPPDLRATDEAKKRGRASVRHARRHGHCPSVVFSDLGSFCPVDELSHGHVERLRLLEVPQVSGIGDDPQLRTGDSRRKLAGERDIGAVPGPAQHKRRHRNLTQSRAQIDAADLPQSRDEGALAAAAEILPGALDVLGRPTRIHPGKHTGQQRLRSDPVIARCSANDRGGEATPAESTSLAT
jgi:hypothetical protein